MTLTEELQRSHAPLWEQMVTHPFVRELGEGTLPLEKFRFYFVQDYRFLEALVKIVSLAIAKAPDFATARHLEEFLRGILTGEEALFSRGFQQLAVTAEESLKVPVAPTTLAFINYLVRLAYEGSFEEILAALTVSEWSYYDWASRLAKGGERPPQEVYQGWIDLHTTRELREFVAFLRGHLDGAELSPPQRARVEEAFLTTLRYEVRFWEMAYHGEGWE